MGVFWVGERKEEEEEGGKGALGRLLIYLAATLVVLLVPGPVVEGASLMKGRVTGTHTCLSLRLPAAASALPCPTYHEPEAFTRSVQGR